MYNPRDRAVANKIDEVNAKVSHHFVERRKKEHQRKVKEIVDTPIENLVD